MSRDAYGRSQRPAQPGSATDVEDLQPAIGDESGVGQCGRDEIGRAV